nr:MAG TPA: hypothetical protein [Caudoviricetes sp.]
MRNKRQVIIIIYIIIQNVFLYLLHVFRLETFFHYHGYTGVL